jgi:aldehyde dehydrogenase (NAD+)
VRRPGAPRWVSTTGFFVKPTVFSNVTNDMTIAQEEIFGPVLSMIGYKDEEDAVRIANDTVPTPNTPDHTGHASNRSPRRL